MESSLSAGFSTETCSSNVEASLKQMLGLVAKDPEFDKHMNFARLSLCPKAPGIETPQRSTFDHTRAR